MKSIRFLLAGIALAIGILTQGCGGSGSQAALPAPTTKSKSAVSQHLAGLGMFQAGATFTTFGHGLPIPTAHPAASPTYVTQLGLWMVVNVSATTFTETFYADQAETEPAGSATYTLDVSTKTLSGAISITKGQYAGISGTYSQTLTKNGTTGSYTAAFPSGTSISCQFSLAISATGIPTGTGTETVTESNGYSETAHVKYLSDGSTIITASDSNGYKSILKFASNGSGTGTISGPDPGLPATIVWNSAGTGTVTFIDGITLSFTNWQIPNP